MLFGPHNTPRKLSFLLLLPVVHGYSAGRAVAHLLILVAFNICLLIIMILSIYMQSTCI